MKNNGLKTRSRTYLNLISFRGELAGITAASRGLFDKEPNGLTEVNHVFSFAHPTSPNSSAKGIIKRSYYWLTCFLRCYQGNSIQDAYPSIQKIRSDISIAPHVAPNALTKGKKEVRCT